MKKLSVILALVALFVTSCSDDIGVSEPIVGKPTIPVEISNEIVQVTSTRINDAGFCDGDAVGVYVVNYENDAPGVLHSKGNQVDNMKFTYDEANNKWVPMSEVYYRDEMTLVDIVGYYPYASPSNVNAYAFEVAKDQSSAAANGELGGYEASDFLWGKAEKVSPKVGRANIKFHHHMAGVLVELSEGTGFADGEWAEVEKELLVSNVKRNAIINLATGEVKETGEVPNTATIPYKSGTSYRAIVVPQTIAASTALFNITVDGTSYIYRKNEAFTYTSGKLHKFTIEVSKKSQSGLEFKLLGESITAWEDENITHDGMAREYVIIHVPEASTDGSSALRTAIEAEGKDYTKIKNLKVTGEINAQDFDFMREDMSILESINLKEVKIRENEIPGSAFAYKSVLKRFVFPEGITSIGGYAFWETSLSGSLILPDEITHIGAYAFYFLGSLTGNLVLPKNLIEIGDGAFAGNFSGELSLPNSVKRIGCEAFSSCKFTGELILPESLEEIGEYAFFWSRFTGSLIIPDKIKVIPREAFNNCSFDGQLVLSKNLEEIGEFAFSGVPFSGELILPQGLQIIRDWAFYNSNITTLKLPETLLYIGEYAFWYCSSMTGILVIPQEVTRISTETFTGCSHLEGVVLPENLEIISNGAFRGCYNLVSIVSNATTPPLLEGSVFDGVNKENVVIEVPEASVVEYSLSPGWSEFKRITAHHDFTISSRLYRTLNAQESRTLVLRAPSNESWSVESKPDWVTITPTSGTGKAEITITVNELAKGNGLREGEVVFLLDDKDYRCRTKVEQYDYIYGDGDVITYQTASKGEGVNLVFMGDCFDAKDITEGKYLSGTTEAIEHFFAVEPYKSYRDYFNVYVVLGMSPDSGIGTVNTIREAKFSSQYSLGDGITLDEKVCFEYACKAPTVTTGNINEALVVLVENSSEYDGLCYMWDDGSAIAVCPMSNDEYPYDFRGIIQHEAGGHGFGKLGDENISHNSFVSLCCPSEYAQLVHAIELGWYKNLSLTANIYDVPWSHLIFDEKYQNTVDIYEGGHRHTRGIFRSEPNSCMNNYIPYFSVISREEIVKRIKRYAGEEFSFEEWKSNDNVAVPDDETTRSMTIYNDNPSRSKKQGPKFMGENSFVKKDR